MERWTPKREPELFDGVWFDAAARRALLLVETHAAGFDPNGQQAALDVLQAAIAQVAAGPGVRALVSGPGSFSALMKARTQAEATALGTMAAVGMLLLLSAAYRRGHVLLLAALPVVSAGIPGLVGVSWVYGEVHGITLAFGFTLMGVAQDYPIHLFSHQRPGVAPLDTAARLWPTMATGVASTCIGYLAFLGAGVEGLSQLAVFTVPGLVVAGLTTRYVLPRVMGTGYPDSGEAAVAERLSRWLGGLQTPRWLPALLLAGSVLALAAPGPVWEDDLAGLTPVPRELLELDSELRRELGAPDVRFLLAVEGETADEVLVRLETLRPTLLGAVRDGILGGFNDAATYLPASTTQMRRRNSLPAPDLLRVELNQALLGLPFSQSAFDAFISDVAATQQLPPMGPGDLKGSVLESIVDALLSRQGSRWIGMVTLSDVQNAQALEERVAGTSGLVFVDFKRASTLLVVEQRTRMLWTLCFAALLLALVVGASLRSGFRAMRVMAPMVITTALTTAVLHASGQPLNSFHLISLVLAAGIGLDYALFFERANGDARERRRTFHGVLVCAASTLMVFALLGFSTIPVLRSIGITVALGVASNFILAALLARAGESDGEPVA